MTALYEKPAIFFSLTKSFQRRDLEIPGNQFCVNAAKNMQKSALFSASCFHYSQVYFLPNHVYSFNVSFG